MKKLLVAAAALVLPVAANVISNPSFESGSGQTSYSSTGFFSSPAADWNGWNNTGVLTTLEILPTTLPLASAGSQMMHISSQGGHNGIYQFFGGNNYYAGAWFYVNSGSGYLWLVDGSQTKVFTSTTKQWEWVAYSSPIGTNEITVYTGAGGGDFYVDLVGADTRPLKPEALPSSHTPEPVTSVLALAGLAGILLSRRRG